MEVEFLSLKKAYLESKAEFDALWLELNDDAHYILGNRLAAFEREFSEYIGAKEVIGVGDGLDALVIALKALGVKDGDEVIVPAHTYIASWLAVSEVGASVVPVDIDPRNYLINIDLIEQVITPRTKAIMPVHLYGRVCDMKRIKEIALRYKLKIIEDAAQAHGGFDESGIKAGASGDVAGFSFYPGKNLGCFGDGGCIATNDHGLAEKIRMIRNYGSKQRYEHQIMGVNSRLDEIQAGVLSIKLKYLDEWNRRRQSIAHIYLEELKGLDSITLPEFTDGHVWHIFPILTTKRDDLQKFLLNNGITTLIHYPTPIHLQNAYAHLNIESGTYPVTERIAAEELSLPIGPHLSSDQVRHVTRVIKDFFIS
jgi:dTDP-4-amino-4,6-dideoxygalactose transaminase